MLEINLSPTQQKQIAKIVREADANPKYDAIEYAKFIVDRCGVEPVAGKIVNELAVYLGDGIEVSIEGRVRNGRIAIVRVEGRNVLHALHPIDYVPGDWERVIAAKVVEIAWPSVERVLKAGPAPADFIVNNCGISYGILRAVERAGLIARLDDGRLTTPARRELDTYRAGIEGGLIVKKVA